MHNIKFHINNTKIVSSKQETNHTIDVFIGSINPNDRINNPTKSHDDLSKELSGSFGIENFTDGPAICIDLFAIVNNFQGQPTKKRIGTLTTLIETLNNEYTTLDIVNISAGIKKATVDIKIEGKIPNTQIGTDFIPQKLLNTTIQRDIDNERKNIIGASTFLSRVRMPCFITRTGPIPGVAFWDMHGIDVPSTTSKKWFNDACFRHDIEPTKFKEYPNKHADVLATFCTIYANTCTYVADFVWDKNRKIDIESFENTAITQSGDCEDLAWTINQVFNHIHNNPDVKQLHEIAQKYVCVATLGEVSKPSAHHITSSERMAHMWCMLLPKGHLDPNHTHTDGPIKVMEGTGRVAPDMNKIQLHNTNISPPYTSEMVVKNIDFYRRVAHIFPSKPINTHRCMGYSVLNNKTSNQRMEYGVEMDNIDNGSFTLWKHPTLTTDEEIAIQHALGYEHPSISLHPLKIKTHNDTHAPEIKLLSKILQGQARKVQRHVQRNVKRQIIGLFFVKDEDINIQNIKVFANEIKNISFDQHDINKEFGNVYCIRLTTYDS